MARTQSESLVDRLERETQARTQEALAYVGRLERETHAAATALLALISTSDATFWARHERVAQGLAQLVAVQRFASALGRTDLACEAGDAYIRIRSFQHTVSCR